MNPDTFGRSMWDERYAADGYLFGKEPAAFLVNHASLLKTGMKALVVADGEGRNSAYLAGLGLDVTAFDISEVGVDKARRLLAERGLSVNLEVADIKGWDWKSDAYDLVVGVFIQFVSPGEQEPVFASMRHTLRPGGQILLHGYRPEQVELGTGGPPDPKHMYTEDLLAESFADFDINVLESYTADITEGTGHAGKSALIDLVATKPPAGS